MKKLFWMIAFLYCCTLAEAQSSEKSTDAVLNMSLSKKYPAKLLDAYQDNAKSKVDDLFSYFQMLTDASLSDDYKKEIIKNIQYLFKNQNQQVIDFTSPAKDKILLDRLIEKLLISEPISFRVSGTWRNARENALSWEAVYTVSRTKSGVTDTIEVSQLVFLFEENKSFGNAAKHVTVTFLGNMD
ncbi:MAG: hypothetical protein QM710_13235 [Flavobacterium sp.]